MFAWMQVALAVVAAAAATTAAGAASSPDASDQCFYPAGNSMSCAGRGLEQAPSGVWPGIAILTLSNGAIARLHPNALSGFPDIYLLYLQSNALTALDLAVFAKAPQLVYLYLDNNLISNLSASASATADGARLDKLTYFYITNNKISALHPDVLQIAPNLLYAFFDNNPLVVAEGQPVLNHPMLELLEATGGNLGKLGPQSFAGLPNLKDVILESSGITDISGSFVTNSKLRTVSLQGNGITEVKAGAFPEGGSVQSLVLSYNPLAALEVAAVQEAVAKGGSIAIVDTPLACSCGYADLQRWAQGAGVALQASCATATCSF